MIKKVIKWFIFGILIFAILFVIKQKFGVDVGTHVINGVSSAGEAVGNAYLDHEDEIKAGAKEAFDKTKEALEKGKLVDKANELKNNAIDYAKENGLDEKAKEAGSGLLDKLGNGLKDSFNWFTKNGNVIP